MKTSSTTTTGVPGSSAKPRRSAKAPSLRSTNIAGSPSARAVSCPMTTPPSAGETTARGAELRQLARQLAARACSARSGHISSRAHWRYRSEWRPEESRKWPVSRAPVSSKSLSVIIAASLRQSSVESRSRRSDGRSSRSRDLSSYDVAPPATDLVVLDLLVEVRARRLDDLGGAADVPAVLAELARRGTRARRTP